MLAFHILENVSLFVVTPARPVSKRLLLLKLRLIIKCDSYSDNQAVLNTAFCDDYYPAQSSFKQRRIGGLANFLVNDYHEPQCLHGFGLFVMYDPSSLCRQSKLLWVALLNLTKSTYLFHPPPFPVARRISSVLMWLNRNKSHRRKSTSLAVETMKMQWNSMGA